MGDSSAASDQAEPAEPAGHPLADPDRPHQPAQAGRSPKPSLVGTLVATSGHHEEDPERSNRDKRCPCLGEPAPCSCASALLFPTVMRPWFGRIL
jgi:hypothetical protein